MRLVVELPDDLLIRFREATKGRGVTQGSIVRHAIEQFIAGQPTGFITKQEARLMEASVVRDPPHPDWTAKKVDLSKSAQAKGKMGR